MKILSILLVLMTALTPARAASLPDPTSFSVAIERGDLAQAREWLDAGLAPDFEGRLIGTGLMIGAWEGNVPMMELFVSRGADINKTNSHGEQALLQAAWKGRLEAVRWLVEHGARLNRAGREWGALHYAAFAGHAEVLAYLLERGADINALSTNGSTPLMMAAREGKEAIAKALLAGGARRDIVNEQGDDALRWAMRYNNLQIAREIAGHESFAAAAARPVASWGRPQRSQPVPDRADLLLAQARRMEAAGRRDEALKVYRAALAAIRQADAASSKASSATRAATGMVITARRGKPGAQTAALNYATPAAGADPSKVPEGTHRAGAGGTANASGVVPPDMVDDWLRRARELEAAGRRKEALQAYRQAAGVLRSASQAPAPVYSPIDP
ncbi:MAG: ankyrin repeat domain-containing protein [Rhodocyclales bacterium]|nr:ankyrin repeat domain-containing protein [Rhodocyclales bacterium]